MPSTRKIFVDVGGHWGETVEAIIDPIFAFDIIYTFEPSQQCAEHISNRFEHVSRINVINAGLGDRQEKSILIKPGSEGASFFKDHSGLDSENMRDEAYRDSEECEILDASEWFLQHLSSEDFVVVKLNCEGAEIAILDRLLETGEIHKIDNLLVDFDARKIPSLRDKISGIRSRLDIAKIAYYSPEEVQYGGGSHYGGIQQWLRKTGVKETTFLPLFHSFIYHLKNLVRGNNHNWYKLMVLNILPKRITSHLRNRHQ